MATGTSPRMDKMLVEKWLASRQVLYLLRSGDTKKAAYNLLSSTTSGLTNYQRIGIRRYLSGVLL